VAESPESRGNERGQASVELVAVLPVVLLVGAIAWQLALAGHALWLTAGATRAAARAEILGRSPREAARSALPKSLERGLAVKRLEHGRIRVSTRIPWLLSGKPGRLGVTAEASLGGQP
jgi:type II secretory pathway component PulK